MMTEENLEAGYEQEFCYMVLGQCLFTQTLDESLPNHPKIVKALRRLLRRAAEEILAVPVTLKVMQSGETGFMLPATLTNREDAPAAMVVLAPTLEKDPQSVVDYTVAHEFAHVLTDTEAQKLLNAPCGNCHGEDGCTDDCPCWDSDEATMCQACRDFDYHLDAHLDPLDYVMSPPERLADDQVVRWGYKLPTWKAEIRTRSASGTVASDCASGELSQASDVSS